MKNPKTTSVLVGLGLVLVLNLGYARGRPVVKNYSTNTFINNTGQAVGGLHIQYNYLLVAGSFFFWQNPDTFANLQTDGKGGVDLSSGTVPAGSSVQISINDPAFRSPPGPPGARDLSVQTWWWTDGTGILVGKTHNGCTNPDCTSP